tara:strand:+ start:207 stop:791 length:585 start_codon:yes stop_codon:yes gene_type:complete
VEKLKYLPITVQWNTHSLAEAKVFGLDTKQTFNPQPMDNVLDQGGFDKVNPNVFVGKRTRHVNFEQEYKQESTYFGPDPNLAPDRFVDPKGIYDPWSKSAQDKAAKIEVNTGPLTPVYQDKPVNFTGLGSPIMPFLNPEKSQQKKDIDCGWFGEKCWKPLSLFDGGLGSLPLVIVGGVAGYFLLKTVIKGKLGI